MFKPSLSPYTAIILSICCLPFLFVVHHIQRFFPFLSFGDIFLTLIKYLVIGFFSWLAIFGITRDKSKTNLLNIIWLFAYFFFSSVHDFLILHGGETIFVQYRFFLPFSVLLLLFLLWGINRSSRNFISINSYIFTVVMIFVLMDCAIMVKKFISPLTSGPVQLAAASEFTVKPCSNCPKPDIYLLVFDEFASSSSLKFNLGYDNSVIDSFLIHNRFKVFPYSRSNYYWTQFSLASILNMTYLDVPRKDALIFDDYASAMALIKHNRVVSDLKKIGYEIRNISAFDLEGLPAPVQYLPSDFGMRRMDEHTIFNTINRDIGWNFRNKETPDSDSTALHDEIEFSLLNHGKTIQYVVDASKEEKAIPRFIYGHFFFPHAPFILDSSGNRRTAAQISGDSSQEAYIKSYLNYLPAVDKTVMQLLTEVKNNSKGNSIIIVMGDHGFRPGSGKNPGNWFFQNLMAVYLPPGLTVNYYDSISAVNHFRILFKDVFHQEVPLISDSVEYLRDK